MGDSEMPDVPAVAADDEQRDADTESAMLDSYAAQFASATRSDPPGLHSMPAIQADRLAKLRQLEDDVQGSKRVVVTNPAFVQNFSNFVNAGLTAAHAGGPLASPSVVGQASELLDRLYMSATGRRTTLSRGTNGMPGETTIPAAVHADDVAEGTTKGIPRPSPIAAPEGVVVSEPHRLDMRTISMGWAMRAAAYHSQQAAAIRAAHTSRHDSMYRPEIGGATDPIECSMEHVAWSLTEPWGPFKPCSNAMCEGEHIIGVPASEHVRLKQYVSPLSREQYERTGDLPSKDEHGRPHVTMCIICYTLAVSAVAARLETMESAQPMFPTFYNSSGRPGTYARSALTNFASPHAGGAIRAVRNFRPDQFLASASIHVKETRRDALTNAISSSMVAVRGYVERRDIVEWRPDVEYNPAKEIYLHEAPPMEPPSNRPPHAPISSDGTPAVPGFVVRPPETIDMAAVLRQARAPVVHMLPRQPVATGISYIRTSPADAPKRAAKPGGRPKKAAAPKPPAPPRPAKSGASASSRKPSAAKRSKATHAADTATTNSGGSAAPSGLTGIVVKKEPIEEPYTSSPMGGLETFISRLAHIKRESESAAASPAVPKFKSLAPAKPAAALSSSSAQPKN